MWSSDVAHDMSIIQYINCKFFVLRIIMPVRGQVANG